MKNALTIILVMTPVLSIPQFYAGVDMGVTKKNLNVNFHTMVKCYDITLEPTVKLFVLGDAAPFMAGTRIGYEYGHILSITPFAGCYMAYHGNTESDKTEVNGLEWEYGLRLKWSPQSQDAAGFYVDIAKLKRDDPVPGTEPFTSITFGMTIFEPNNKKKKD
jgi:hypothetical protein